jgi:hypothetical protein
MNPQSTIPAPQEATSLQQLQRRRPLFMNFISIPLIRKTNSPPPRRQNSITPTHPHHPNHNSNRSRSMISIPTRKALQHPNLTLLLSSDPTSSSITNSANSLPSSICQLCHQQNNHQGQSHLTHLWYSWTSRHHVSPFFLALFPQHQSLTLSLLCVFPQNGCWDSLLQYW